LKERSAPYEALKDFGRDWWCRVCVSACVRAPPLMKKWTRLGEILLLLLLLVPHLQPTLIPISATTAVRALPIDAFYLS
jgi:hypothetical protein